MGWGESRGKIGTGKGTADGLMEFNGPPNSMKLWVAHNTESNGIKNSKKGTIYVVVNWQIS